MSEYYFWIGLPILCACIIFAALFIRGMVLSQKFKLAELEALNKVNAAKTRSDAIIKESEIEAKDRLLKMKNQFDAETKEIKAEFKKEERRLIQKEENLDKKREQLEQKIVSINHKKQELQKKEQELIKRDDDYKKIIDEQQLRLEAISGLTTDKAKQLLLESIEEEARHDSAILIKKIENEALEQANKKAVKILAAAIQRYAGDYVSENTISVVQLPNDDMKGRIIGREGRNIKAIEAATGIEVLIDDTPEAVILSGFNPVRREVARLSLTKLIADGRIHPARIESIVKKVEKEVAIAIKEAGEQALFDLGIHGISSELVESVGRLKYRTSYTQNVLQHSIEVGFLAGIMASELGLNVKLAKRAGILHDIGKGLDHEIEGSHANIGAKLAKKHGENQVIVHAIAAHHEEEPPESVYDLLVQAGDALSGARPGARKELLENYIKRLEDLEAIANSFKGVSTSYAIQAGRELRVIVESAKLSDEESVLLSRDIAKKIDETMTFPGPIKITVIRETRSIEYANK
jgi:ribonucrease Y